MTESKGVTITGKNLGVWIAIATIIVGSIVDSALTRSQVQDNTKELETYNLSLIDYQLTEINQKQDDISMKLDELEHLILSFHGQ